jgi:predicted porin
MRKLSVGIALTMAVSGFAYGQSSMTLYGVLDTGLNFVSNSGGKTQWQMSDGTLSGIYGSRWGLTGKEDLGAGVSVGFKLESGFSSSNGQFFQGGREFGRQAYVELSDNNLGSLSLGRQYDEIVDFVQPVTFNGQWGPMFAHAGDIDNTSDSFRVSNAIKFRSLDYHGVSFAGMLGLTNSNAPGVAPVGTWSAGARYQNGRFLVSGAYFYAKNPATLFPDGDFVGNTTGAAIGASGPFSYVGNPANQQIIGIGTSYGIDAFTFGGDYTRTLFGSANGTASTTTFSNYEAWMNYAVDSTLTVGGEYTFTAGKTGYSNESIAYHLAGLVADKKLSKRTDVYAMASYQRAAADVRNADIFDGAIANASSGRNQGAVRIGMVHKF